MEKLKINNSIRAVCPARTINGKIELLDVSFLRREKANSVHHDWMKEEDSLRSRIDQGINFFYTIEEVTKVRSSSKKLLCEERGIACIKKVRNKFYLERLFATESVVNTDIGVDISPETGFLNFEDDHYLIIGSYVPDNWLYLYAPPNSVVCSTTPFTPSPVEIDDNCLLGRMNGDIQSIDRKELGIILGTEHIISSLASTKSPILVNSDYFELLSEKSKFSCAQFVFRPTDRRPRNREAGTLIFNSSKKCFEAFDGGKWRPLKWGDE